MLRLKLNQKKIFKISCFIILILGALNLTNIPNTNAYFKKAETKVLEVKQNLYKVQEIKTEINGINSMSDTGFIANIKFIRNDDDANIKLYTITCGNTKSSLSLANGIISTIIPCGIPATNDEKKIELKIEEMISNVKKQKIPFLCGTNIINYEGFGSFRASLVELLKNNININYLWTNRFTPEGYLTFNNMSNDSLISKSSVANIGVSMNDNNVFSEDTNFVGYVKTYDYYKNIYATLPDAEKQYKLYFTTDENEEATLSDKNTKLRNAFKTYLEKYIYTTSTESNMVEKVYNYVISKCQDFTQIVNGSLTIQGLTKVDDYIVLDKVEIQKAITEYEKELKKYEDFLTQTDSYKESFNTTTNYLNSLPKINTNPIYTAITDTTYSKNPQYIVYYDQAKDSTEQYLSLVEVLNNGTTSTLTISELDQTSLNNMLSAIRETDNLYIDIYADANTAKTLKSEFEKLLENKSFAIISDVLGYGYEQISYEIKGLVPINNVVDEPQEDDENKEEKPTFKDYQNYLDTIKEQYKTYEKTYAYISEETENNIFYKNFISTNPTNLNYIYFENAEEEITLTYVTMTKEKEILIEALNKDKANELNAQLETGLKVHLTKDEDQTEIINAVNTLLEINPVGLAKTTNFALTTSNNTVLTYISANDNITSDITIQNLNNLDDATKQQLITEIDTKTKTEDGFTINYQDENDKLLLTNAINSLLDFTPDATEELSKYIISDNNGTITYKLNSNYQEEITPPENPDNPEETDPTNPEDGNKDENQNKEPASTNPAPTDNQEDDNQDQPLDETFENEAPNTLADSSAETNPSTSSQPELATSTEVYAPTLEINDINTGLNNI